MASGPDLESILEVCDLNDSITERKTTPLFRQSHCSIFLHPVLKKLAPTLYRSIYWVQANMSIGQIGCKGLPQLWRNRGSTIIVINGQ